MDPLVIERRQEASVSRAIFLSGTMLVLFLVRVVSLLRGKAAADAAGAEQGKEVSGS